MPRGNLPILDEMRDGFPRAVEQIRHSFDLSTPSINVREFGAIGDGVADDTAAIQAAIDEVSKITAGTPGGVVYFPKGDFLTNTGVTVAKNNVWLRGVGYGSRIVNGGTTNYAVTIGDGISRYNRCGMRDLGIGQSASVTPTSGGGLRVRMLAKAVFSNLYLPQFPAPLWNGIRIQDEDAGSKFWLCRVANTINIGIDAFDTLDLTLEECKAQACGVIGIKLDACEGAQTLYTESGLSNPTAWYITDSGGGTRISQNHKHFGSVGDASTLHNWHIDKLQRGRFLGCWGGTTVSGTGNNFLFDGSAAPNADVKSIIFDGCRSLSAQGHGISALGVQGMVINGCKSDTNGQSGAAGSNGFAGFHFDDCDRVVLVGNSATFHQDYGVSLTGTACTNMTIGPNSLRGNSISGFNEATFPTSSTIVHNNTPDAAPTQAAAATLVQLPARMDIHNINATGAQIDHIPSDYEGRRVSLVFSVAANVGHGIGASPKIFLRGLANKAFAANETLTLVSFGGDWYEV